MNAVNATICIITVFQITDKACCKYHSNLRYPTWNSPNNLFRGLQNAMCSQVYLIVHDMNSISWAAGTSSHFWTSIAFQFGEGNGTLLQYSCLENPMDGGAWEAAVVGSLRVGHDRVTSLSLFTFMRWRRKWNPLQRSASVLAWRIPGTEEPSGLPSLGSHRVGYNWGHLTAAAAAAFQFGTVHVNSVIINRMWEEASTPEQWRVGLQPLISCRWEGACSVRSCSFPQYGMTDAISPSGPV